MQPDELEALKRTWSTQFADVDHRVATIEHQLAEGARRRVRLALLPGTLWTAAEGVLAASAAIAIAIAVVRHGGDPRYLCCGGASVAVLLGVVAFAVVRVLRTAHLDLARSVVAIQRDVARLRRVEFAALAWTLFGGIVVWLPLPLLLFEAATGAPALADVNLTWLVSNLGFGLLVAAAAVGAARRVGAGTRLRPWIARAADALSGRGMRRAAVQLTELEQFARGE